MEESKDTEVKPEPPEDLKKVETEETVEVPHRVVMANSLPHRQDG